MIGVVITSSPSEIKAGNLAYGPLKNPRNYTPHIICGGFGDVITKYDCCGCKNIFSIAELNIFKLTCDDDEYLCDKYNVDFFLSGHLHEFGDVTVRGTRYVKLFQQAKEDHKYAKVNIKNTKEYTNSLYLTNKKKKRFLRTVIILLPHKKNIVFS